MAPVLESRHGILAAQADIATDTAGRSIAECGFPVYLAIALEKAGNSPD
jgi:hypothetical protein